MYPKRDVLLAWCVSSVVALADCGGSASGPTPTPIVTPAPTPTPTPTPASTQPPPCQLTAPTVNCGTHRIKPQELAEFLNPALDAAKATPGVMYADAPERLYDVDLFRTKVIDGLTARGVCGAWDYGNVIGDELYTRSADGCVVEQYDVISGLGEVRAASRKSNVWSGGWENKVPPPRPNWAKQGDQTCSLPGSRITYCFQVKGTGGEFGPAVYALMVEMLDENPKLIDKTDFMAGQGESIPGMLRLGAWRLRDKAGYISGIEAKIRAHGFCGFVRGDILMVKSLEKGNLFHEEMDIIQNPSSGGDYTGFVLKDRCHAAGF